MTLKHENYMKQQFTEITGSDRMFTSADISHQTADNIPTTAR
jgi:hypothetical protein